MKNIIISVNTALWGVPVLLLILGVGIWLSVRLRFVQVLLFPKALKSFFRQLLQRQDQSSFRSFCTALAATVGTGNLVGVAGAICIGGPGAVFWMWVCGFLGMAVKYAEALLAVRYRIQTPSGYAGGPMYIITLGLPGRLHFLARLYAVFGIAASFGVGNITQINAAVSGIHDALSVCGFSVGKASDFLLALLFASVIGVFLFGGAKRIYAAAEQLMPFAAMTYVCLCAVALLLKGKALPMAFSQIICGAFSPGAVTGGMLGSAFVALRVGCSRGVFTNEAGMGTASIAHAGADGVHPAQQGLMGIMEVFLDTIVICTITALVILVSGVPIPYGTDAGASLTTKAFSAVYGPGACLWLALVMSMFAVAAVMGWGLYGGSCGEFLFGSKFWKPYAALQAGAMVLGSLLETPTVWLLAESFNGLMAIPNLITLAVLTPEVIRLTKEYRNSGRTTAGGGNYANFHQRKSL